VYFLLLGVAAGFRFVSEVVDQAIYPISLRSESNNPEQPTNQLLHRPVKKLKVMAKSNDLFLIVFSLFIKLSF
jgi:hypothetical protein